MKKWLLVTCMLITLCLIIGFSLQPAGRSNHTSKSFTQLLVPAHVPNRDQVIARLNNTIRDCAHVFEYFVLSFVTLLFAMQLRWRTVWRILGTLLFVLACALIDENVQVPVPGRAFEWIDVCKDMLGYLIALLLVTTGTWLHRHLRAKTVSLTFARPTFLEKTQKD
ncbi:MAG: VanZ family protein [Cellulosilyticaceae bacterium]